MLAEGFRTGGFNRDGRTLFATVRNDQPGRALSVGEGNIYAAENGAVIAAALAEVDAVIAGGMEAIVAAGGVCGPAAPYYGQLTTSSAARPVRDALLGFSGSRGAITFVPPPQLVDIGISGGSPNQAVDVITNAEDVSNTVKPHQLISCGTPETTTVEAVTLILEAGNLMARTAPEQWLAILTEAQAAHARMAERELLTAIGSASTAVTSADAGTLGASRDLLRDWIRAAEGLRYRARMDDGAPSR